MTNKSTSTITTNAITQASNIKQTMQEIANATQLTWEQMYRATLIMRNARDNALADLDVASGQPQRDIANVFNQQVGSAVNISTLLPTVIAQGEVYNSAIFTLFTTKNSVIYELIVPANPADDRIVQPVQFTGTDIDPIKTAASAIVTSLVAFA